MPILPLAPCIVILQGGKILDVLPEGACSAISQIRMEPDAGRSAARSLPGSEMAEAGTAMDHERDRSEAVPAGCSCAARFSEVAGAHLHRRYYLGRWLRARRAVPTAKPG